MIRDARLPAVFLTGSYALLNIYATQPLLSSLAAEWRLPATASGWTITATTLAIALCAPLAGAISDRFGRKRVIVTAMFGMALSTLLCALASSFAALLALRFVQGTFVPFVFATAVAYIDEEWERPAAARVNALYVSGSVLGGFLGRFVSGTADGLAGWRASFVALAAIGLGIACLVALRLPVERRFHPAASVGASLRGIGRHLRNAPLLATCVVGAALLFAQVASFTYASLHLAAPPFSLDSAALGMVFAVFLVGVIATPMSGRAVVRFGRARTFAAAVSLCGVGLLLCLVPATAAVIAGLACCSTGVFAGQVCATGQAAIAAGRAKSSGVGLYLSCYYLGGSLGAVVPAPAFRIYGFAGCAAEIALVLAVGLVVALAAWSERAGGAALEPAHRGT
ncbi:MAG: MFS transporter [Polyangiales bacterium]